MKYLSLLLFLAFTTKLIAQDSPRLKYEKDLQVIVNQMKEETDATFEKGPIFIFEKPFTATFTQATEYGVGAPPNRTNHSFDEGDIVHVLGAQPIGKVLRFKVPNSDVILETKAFGHPGFEIDNADDFKSQVGKIKNADWKEAEQIASMLDCGALAESGKPNFEKHHMTLGDTPVFFQVRMEEGKILLYFDLRTYGGTDFKDMGVAEAEKSILNLTCGDGTYVSIACQSDDERQAIFDITDYSSPLLSGITTLNISLSDKEITKELAEIDQYSIGLKMECMEIE